MIQEGIILSKPAGCDEAREIGTVQRRNSPPILCVLFHGWGERVIFRIKFTRHGVVRCEMQFPTTHLLA